MLKKIIDNNLISFSEKFDSWENAIRASCKSLILAGVCDQGYPEEIIGIVNQYGPYIIIAPYVAMPHSTLGGPHVYKSAISFMKVDEPVIFDVNDRSKDAKLFFTLAAENSEKHLKNMCDLMDMLTTDGLIEDLLNVRDVNGLISISESYQL